MKVRTGGRTVEIPDERMRKGGVDRTRIQVGRDDAPQRENVWLASIAEPMSTEPVSSPAPSSLPGWPKPTDDSKPVIFTLEGQLKSGKNRVLITRTGHRYSPKEFQVWRQVMIEQIGIVERTITGPVELIADYVPGDLIKRDVDGMLSALFHVIVKAGLLLDDAQVKNVHWHQWPLDRKNPKCRVSLVALDGQA